jgi:large conductance mechanosensitive channel
MPLNPALPMLSEFKKFILKGNVVDLSTGVIIGAAFGNIVGAFTKGIVDPLIKKLSSGGDPNITLQVWIFDLGLVINALIGFLITAAVIFFVIVKPANRLMALMRKEEAAAPPPPPPAEVQLLTEIRDLLKK